MCARTPVAHVPSPVHTCAFSQSPRAHTRTAATPVRTCTHTRGRRDRPCCARPGPPARPPAPPHGAAGRAGPARRARSIPTGAACPPQGSAPAGTADSPGPAQHGRTRAARPAHRNEPHARTVPGRHLLGPDQLRTRPGGRRMRRRRSPPRRPRSTPSHWRRAVKKTEKRSQSGAGLGGGSGGGGGGRSPPRGWSRPAQHRVTRAMVPHRGGRGFAAGPDRRCSQWGWRGAPDICIRREWRAARPIGGGLGGAGPAPHEGAAAERRGAAEAGQVRDRGDGAAGTPGEGGGGGVDGGDRGGDGDDGSAHDRRQGAVRPCRRTPVRGAGLALRRHLARRPGAVGAMRGAMRGTRCPFPRGLRPGLPPSAAGGRRAQARSRGNGGCSGRGAHGGAPVPAPFLGQDTPR